MLFRGRSVLTFILLTMIVSVLVTLVVVDQLTTQKPSSVPAVASAALGSAAGKYEPEHELQRDEMSKLNAVLELIETKYYKKIERKELMDGAISGMLNALDDPYSVYMEEDVAQQFSESVEGSFTGIGAEVTIEGSRIVVVSPIKGSPAERAGLLAKDILLSVNGESLDGLSLQEAVAKIRGPKGTKAKLQVLREGVSEPINLALIRDDIDVETVYAQLNEDGTGIIEIRQFSMNTAERFKEELESLEAKGMKGLVIDVRNNPGGVLPVVVDIAQQFLAKGQTIVQVEDREGRREKTVSQGTAKSYPIAVLMNQGSASASEILAGALKEGAGAKLIGESTFGKGTVQVSYNKMLGDGSLVKMTIAKWLTPNGNWIHETGIQPDIEVAPSDLYTVARLALTEELKVDMLGERVRSAQIMLHGIGYEPNREDGYFDQSTEAAVKSFQTDNGLQPTGIINEQTAQALEAAAVKWMQDESNDIQLHEAIKAVSRK